MVEDITDLEIEVEIESERSIEGIVTYAGPKGEGMDTGFVSMFAGSIIPEKWLLCNGQEVSRTLYSKLFSVIGTTYGAGDGYTTFNIPNINISIQNQHLNYIIKS